jgi:hypothetical protein
VIGSLFQALVAVARAASRSVTSTMRWVTVVGVAATFRTVWKARCQKVDPPRYGGIEPQRNFYRHDLRRLGVDLRHRPPKAHHGGRRHAEFSGRGPDADA